MSVITHSAQFSKICRTCLSEERYMKSVFDTDSSLGETDQLFKMLMAFTSVQVVEDDGLPTQICLSCINYIARSFSFKKLCEESDTTLREVLRKSAIIDDQPSIQMQPTTSVALCSQETLADIDREIKMEFEEEAPNSDDLMSSTESIECEKHDIKMMKNVDDLESPTDDSDARQNATKKCDPLHDGIDLKSQKNSICPLPDESERQIYSCAQCNVSFTAEHDLKLHMHSDTHRKSMSKKPKPTCNVCSKVFDRASYLRRHMKAHSDQRPYRCSECGKGFKRADRVTSHLRTHTGEKPYACNVCDKRFAESSTLNVHARTHTNDRKYICAECGLGFPYRNGLIFHLNTHTSIESSTCSICNEKLSNAASLATHMQSHTVMKDCPDCNKRFTTLEELHGHQRVHRGDIPYICKMCNKGFYKMSRLTIHMRTHTGERPHLCDLCGNGYMTATKLKIHMRMHTGERPYQCELCPKAFTRSELLRSHMKRHTGERKHICDHCDKGFYTAMELKIHLRVHTGEKPYTCHICNKCFSQAGILSIHLKTHKFCK